jgi:hypothetical protein
MAPKIELKIVQRTNSPAADFGHSHRLGAYPIRCPNQKAKFPKTDFLIQRMFRKLAPKISKVQIIFFPLAKQPKLFSSPPKIQAQKLSFPKQTPKKLSPTKTRTPHLTPKTLPLQSSKTLFSQSKTQKNSARMRLEPHTSLPKLLLAKARLSSHSTTHASNPLPNSHPKGHSSSLPRMACVKMPCSQHPRIWPLLWPEFLFRLAYGPF